MRVVKRLWLVPALDNYIICVGLSLSEDLSNKCESCIIMYGAIGWAFQYKRKLGCLLLDNSISSYYTLIEETKH